MSSQRTKISNNPNDCKNTRMSIEDLAIGDARTDILAHMSRFSKIADMFIKEANFQGRPISVLDIGCGELYPLRVFYKAHVCKKADIIKSYYGIDIDLPMLQKQQERYASMLELINGKLICQDVTTNPLLEFDSKSIDFFFSTEVIEHMKPEFVPAWLDEADRVLKPGGLIYISTPNHDGSNEKLPIDHVYEWGFEELKTELTKRWKLQVVTGTFIQLPAFKRANKIHKYFTEEQVEMFMNRFDSFWARNVLAGPYPEVSNNCAWILRKRI